MMIPPEDEMCFLDAVSETGLVKIFVVMEKLSLSQRKQTSIFFLIELL